MAVVPTEEDTTGEATIVLIELLEAISPLDSRNGNKVVSMKTLKTTPTEENLEGMSRNTVGGRNTDPINPSCSDSKLSVVCVKFS